MAASATNEIEVAAGHFANEATLRETFGQTQFKFWELIPSTNATIRYVGQCQIVLMSGQCTVLQGAGQSRYVTQAGQVASSYPQVPTINFPNLLAYNHWAPSFLLSIYYRRNPGCKCAECGPKRTGPLLTLSAHLGELFASPENSDVVFEVRSESDEPVETPKPKKKGKRSAKPKDSEEEEKARDSWVEIQAHKLILCSRVPYFKSLFESGMKEANSGRIRIEDAEAGYFRRVLKFIYSGQFPEDLGENPEKYLPIADKYGIDDLKAVSSEAAKKLLKKENVVEMLVLADLHQCVGLKGECVARLREWKAEMDDDAMDPLASYPQLMLECMKKF